jgi:hypothetical protein
MSNIARQSSVLCALRIIAASLIEARIGNGKSALGRLLHLLSPRTIPWTPHPERRIHLIQCKVMPLNARTWSTGSRGRRTLFPEAERPTVSIMMGTYWSLMLKISIT